MHAETKTIEDFVARKLSARPVQQLIETWRVEPEKIFQILVRHFREMGIFTVDPIQEPLMLKNVVHHLKNSPDIMVEVDRAKQEEALKKRSRHAE